MILQMFSIRDAKGENFNQPFFKKAEGEAIRDFTELTKDDKSFISKYPDDFDLYLVGKFDTDRGTIEPLDTPKHLVKAVQVKIN